MKKFSFAMALFVSFVSVEGFAFREEVIAQGTKYSTTVPCTVNENGVLQNPSEETVIGILDSFCSRRQANGLMKSYEVPTAGGSSLVCTRRTNGTFSQASYRINVRVQCGVQAVNVDMTDFFQGQ